jgi:hypothetical protein
MKYLSALLLFALLSLPVFAKDQEALSLAGCGPEKVQFDVKTDKHQRPEVQPDAGKALVYVFENEKRDPDALPVLNVTTRIGVDGNWVAANHGKSYSFFMIDPGNHEVCVNWQSSVSLYSRLSSATTVSVREGKIYYFQADVEQRSHRQPGIRIVPVDPAEAKLLIAASSVSISHPKK